MKVFDIVIVGGGASGMFAAISAKQKNPALNVAIVEKNARVGKKLLATGNGRCNISNYDDEMSRYHGENVKFVISAFSRLSTEKSLDIFNKLGLLTKEESEGKIYPRSGQASVVLDFLRLGLSRLGISEITDFEAACINPSKEKFVIKSKSGDEVSGKCVIVCVGGWAGPQFGTDGSGFKLIEKLGHAKTPVYPALTRLKSTNPFAKSLKGMKFDGVATLKSEGKTVRVEEGEILFTEYGLSGPPILQLSGEAINLLNKNKKPSISLDIIPDKDEQELKNILSEMIKLNPDIPLENFLSGIMNKQIGKMLVKAANIGKLGDRAEILGEKELSKVISFIKGWEFEISGHTGWKDAQTTAGGAKTSEFFPSTMESRLVKNLFVAGEILDIYGDCGGFNLKWAWSSGYLAGVSAAERLSENG